MRIIVLGLIISSFLAHMAWAGVWAADDSVRLNPVTGSLIEERHPAADHITALYQTQNPVFNSVEGVIRLRSGRNEVVAFQVIVDGGPHSGVSIEVTDLTGPQTLMAANHIRRFKEWFIEVTSESIFCDEVGLVTSLGKGWYPDPLNPLDEAVSSGFGQPFNIPDPQNHIPGQSAAAFWIDLLVPAETLPGTYSGLVTVSLDETTIDLPLELVVDNLTLGSTNHAGLGSVNYGGLAFGVLGGSAGAEGLIPWFQMAHAHRLELDALWIWPSKANLPINWEYWLEIWRPFMTGTAFSSEQGYWGPSPETPIRRFVLPLESNWPICSTCYPVIDLKPSNESAWQDALLETENVLIQEGWTGVEAHLFINVLDEPKTEATFELIQYYGDLINSTGLMERSHIRFRLDAGPFKDIASWLPGWDVSQIFAHIGDEIDIWNENAGVRYIDSVATLERIAANPGEKWWFYNTCSAGEPASGSPALEGEALGMRTWGWIVSRYNLQGAVTWEMDGFRNLSCWTNPKCSGYNINGDAVLMYLGEYIGLAGKPVASIRLKNMRRGSQDHEYLRLLTEYEGNSQRSNAIAQRLIPQALDDGLAHDGSTGRWSHDPRVYETARQEISRILAGDSGTEPEDTGAGETFADAEERVDGEFDMSEDSYLVDSNGDDGDTTTDGGHNGTVSDIVPPNLDWGCSCQLTSVSVSQIGLLTALFWGVLLLSILAVFKNPRA